MNRWNAVCQSRILKSEIQTMRHLKEWIEGNSFWIRIQCNHVLDTCLQIIMLLNGGYEYLITSVANVLLLSNWFGVCCV